MKKIFSGEVYDIIPQPTGLVFSYCREVLEDKVVVSYKMISFDTGRITDVAKNIYQLSKFGSNYRKISAECSNYITAKAILLPNGKAFVAEDTGKAMLFDAVGELLWSGDILYRGAAPSDIAVYKNAFWACYPTENVLLRFNLTTLREDLRIGGTKSPFSSPRDMFVEGYNAIISNAESKKLIRINLNSYTVEDYKEFSESVYSYVKIKDYEFVLMESGVYLM